jgi:hypothetical protein
MHKQEGPLWARNSAWIEYPTSNRLVVGSNPTVPVLNKATKKYK